MSDQDGDFFPGAAIRPTARRPRGWQQDHLSPALEGAFSNQIATWVECQAEVRAIREVDEAFLLVMTHQEDDDALEWRLFKFRAHAHFRAAAALILARQLTESMVLIRAMLESAIYGYRITKSDPALTAWAQRHDDPAQRKAMKRHFRITGPEGILTEIGKEAPGLAAALERMYEHSIDFGAHPNVLGVLSSLRRLPEDPTEQEHHLEYTTLDTGRVRRELVALASAGLVALTVFELLRPGWFERSGASDAIHVARGSIQSLRDPILQSLEEPHDR